METSEVWWVKGKTKPKMTTRFLLGKLCDWQVEKRNESRKAEMGVGLWRAIILGLDMLNLRFYTQVDG